MGSSSGISGGTLRLAPRASAEFDEWLFQHLQELGKRCQDRLGSALWALVLGGGYGRGEGGVLKQGDRERPYNDLDLFLLVHHQPEPSILLDLSKTYHEILGVDVDFSRPYTRREVSHWPGCQMFFDLVQGYQLLAGDAAWIEAVPQHCWNPPPRLEASRLLLNRGAGLLWALRVAEGIEKAPDQDFVRRNAYKLRQALGDALLLLHGGYQSRYQGRPEKLRQVPGVEANILTNYERSLEFRLAPGPEFGPQPPVAELQAAVQAWLKIFLHCESTRLQQPAWTDPARYLQDPRPREPFAWKEVARNLRRGRLSLQSRRQALYLDLVELLSQGRWADPQAAQWLQRWRENC